MQLSDGAIVPGNAGIGEEEIELRPYRYWRPYRRAISQSIDTMIETGPLPVILSIHSFTPSWRAEASLGGRHSLVQRSAPCGAADRRAGRSRLRRRLPEPYDGARPAIRSTRK